MQDSAFITSFKQLATGIHANNVEKGFWATKRPFSECNALMHSEGGEATEGWRKPAPDNHCPGFPSMTVELADIVIRTLDAVIGYNFDIWSHLEEVEAETWQAGFAKIRDVLIEKDGPHLQSSFLTDMAEVHAMLAFAYKAESGFLEDEDPAKYLAWAITYIAFMASKFDLDIAGAIEAKFEYNKSRPFMHGKRA